MASKVKEHVVERDEKGRVTKGATLNPKGKPKGAKNRWTKDITSMVQEAMTIAGGRLKAAELENIKAYDLDVDKDSVLSGHDDAVAYLVHHALTKPELFLPMVRQMMPNKIDLDVQIMGQELVETLNERRNQLANMRDVTPKGGKEKARNGS